MPHLRIAFALAMSVAIAPFALDTYLPAFPEMADRLNVGVHDLALTVSVYIGALALGQLIGGALADHHGRRPVMICGLTLFVFTSFLIATVSSLQPLLALRAVQAFGGGWVVVCVPALVRDRVSGAESARLFSLIGLIMVAAPAVAPAVGSLLLAWGGWRSIFVFLGVYGLAAFVVQQRVLFPGGERRRASAGGKTMKSGSFFRGYWIVLRTPSALRFIFLQASVFSVMMLFVTHASFVYQEHFGVSPRTFAAFFAANILAMWLIMMANRRLLHFFAPFVILRGAVILQALAVASLILISFFLPLLGLFVPALMLTVGAVGATSPNCQACYMEAFAENGGTAAALMGAMQFGVAGCVSALSSLMPESLQSIVLAQGACALVALLLALWPQPATSQPPRAQPDLPHR